MNMARASLAHGGGRDWMWGWAVKHAADAANRLLSPAIERDDADGAGGTGGAARRQSRLQLLEPSMTPEKQMRTLHPLLGLCFKTIPHKERGSDFNWRAHPCLHLRYDSDMKSFMLLSLPELHLTDSVEVRHVGMTFPLRATHYRTSQLDEFMRPAEDQGVYDNMHGPGNILRRHRLAPRPDSTTALVQPTPVLVRTPIEPGGTRTRVYTPSMRGLESAASVNTTRSSSSSSSPAPAYTPDQLAMRTPRGTRQALAGPDKEFWLPAILKDFAMLRSRQCFVDFSDKRPNGPAPPGIEQRFKIKYRLDAPIALRDLPAKAFKARTVARGDRFRAGEHFDATAAPVVFAEARKMFIAWGVALGLQFYEWDEDSAFYGNNMDKPVQVRLPPGFYPHSDELRPLDAPPLYATMVKGVPGIPQGSLLQYKDVAPALADLGFAPTQADSCLFVHARLNMAATLHVDDGILACPSLKHAEAILGSRGLGKTRKLTWGPLKSALGIDFKIVYTPQRRTVFMSQPAYAAIILERSGMQDCNSAAAPAIPGRKYTKADCPATDEAKAHVRAEGYDQSQYRTINASVNFLVSMTRPDLRFINGKLNKYNANPGIPHFKAQKHAQRFIKGTAHYGIEFNWFADSPEPVDGPLNIVAYSDSSYADDVDTGRTTLGFVVQVNGATVSAASWLSQRVDSCVNHSELNAFEGMTADNVAPVTDGSSVAMLKMGRTVTWLRGIKAALERRDLQAMPPTVGYVDNNGVLSMLQDITIKSANRHIFRSLAENRERVHLDKIIAPEKVDTKDNLANAMTKQEHSIAESAAQLRLIAGPCTLDLPL
jgi:hypothetical protein